MKSLLVLISLALSLPSFANNEVPELLNSSAVKESLASNEEKQISLVYNRMHLENRCDETIGVFLVYLKLDGQWDTSPGHYEILPGQTKYVANTQNRIYYYAAATVSGSKIWRGPNNIRLDDGSVIPMHEGKITTKDFADWTTIFCY